ncbi:hypothetical protein SMKI_15G0490 [Saccharomyces mikatae IFO 1815]|uniref:Prokaryotic-type class I peptide chain release factors domain-containing protein n=1 Tax=Saccharomyces mikatae IFO 1815 TaxID=226126 RepID=A0AA35NET0_SACMI|nr:uncharacterized protein SMKI_15G0490 [Saccharomyces mikatae IFO 1815]CAI4036211.1 hypothetical protein SMKI_15G0490 [Saccharomyces mikatae IFO 1815]
MFALQLTRHCKQQLLIENAVRLISNEKIWKKPELVRARSWVETLDVVDLPLKQFLLRYDRASGPGGQHVNKVNTKCTLTLPGLSNCAWIPQEVRTILCSGKFRYYAKSSDSVVIQSDETRSKEVNKLKCFEKLIQAIKQTCQFPSDTTTETAKKWAKIRVKSNKERLLNKKVHGDKKKNRSKITFSY